MSRRNEKLYHIYYGMKTRCYNKNDRKYYLYGGKGVIICDEWLDDYENFKSWSIQNGFIENSPPRSMSIDRIDSNGIYEPSNCQWISVSENSAKANLGRKKFNGHREGNVYAIKLSTNEVITVDNITKFAKEINCSPSSICHKANGLIKNKEINGYFIFRK